MTLREPADVPMERVPCNLCGADSTVERYPDTRDRAPDGTEWMAFRCTHPGYGIHPPIVECRECGLLYTNPRPAADDIHHNYEAVEDPTYLEQRYGREATFRRHLRTFERYTGVGAGRRLLDVGAYIGVFVEEARKRGWEAVGLEPSRWAAGYAAGQGVPVTQGVLADGAFEPESFDALTMWDVIEHLSDPLGELRHAYDLLKPGGWIAVHTMDRDSLFARLMGDRWPWLMQMHIYYFTRHTLAAMLEEAGFEVADVRPHGRRLSVRYLLTRLEPYSPALARAIRAMARAAGVEKVLLPVNFGDLVTAYARKPAGG